MRVSLISLSSHKGNTLTDLTTRKVLTQGTTISHYNELVLTLFGYTDYKWRLITGQYRFTDMTRGERQKWVETVSGIDFNYPFKIYAAIKGGMTGIRRAIKEYSNELVNSEDRILNEELREEMLGRKTTLGDVITNIITNKGSTPQADAIRNKIARAKQLDIELGLAKKKFLTHEAPNFQHLNVSSLDEFRDSYLRDTAELDNIDVRFNAVKRDLMEKIELRNTLNTNDRYDMDAARTLLLNKSAELEEAKQFAGSRFKDAHVEGLKYYATNQPQILESISLEVLGSIIHPLDSGVSSEVKSMVTTRVETLSNLIKRNDNTLEHLGELIRTTEEGKDITCPDCNSIFKDGAQDLSGLIAKREETEMDSEVNRTLLNKAENELESIRNTEASLFKMRSIVSKHISNTTVNSTILTSIDGTSSLNDIMDLIKVVLGDARDHYIAMSLAAEVRDISDTITYHEGLAKLGSVQDYINQCDDLEHQLVDIRDERLEMEAKIKQLGSEGKRLRAYIANLDAFHKLMDDHSNAIKEVREMLYANSVGKLLEDLQVELGKLSNDLTNDTINMGIRNKLNAMLIDNTNRLKVLIDLEAAINPSTGIIAEQLTAYCRLFSEMSTQVLSKIWGYDMRILEPIIHPTKGVNYRFPMTVVDDDVISDISHGSTSQKSVVNLAILLASRELLKANGQVLILDEVGGGFDATHDLNLGEYLYELVTTSPSENIFLIHHNESIRGNLGDFDTICFDPSHVVVDSDANEHVRIEYS